MSSLNHIVNECLPSENTDKHRFVRSLMTCIIAKLKLKPIVIDNGSKFNYVIYIESRSKHEADETFNKILEILKEVENKVDKYRDYLSNRRVVVWNAEKFIMFEKEYIIVKAVW